MKKFHARLITKDGAFFPIVHHIQIENDIVSETHMVSPWGSVTFDPPRNWDKSFLHSYNLQEDHS